MVIIYVIPKKSIFYYMEIFSIHGNLRSQLFVDSDGNKRKMGTGGGGGGFVTARIPSVLVKLEVRMSWGMG